MPSLKHTSSEQEPPPTEEAAARHLSSCGECRAAYLGMDRRGVTDGWCVTLRAHGGSVVFTFNAHQFADVPDANAAVMVAVVDSLRSLHDVASG